MKKESFPIQKDVPLTSIVQFCPTAPQLAPSCENPNVNGAPTNCIWYIAVSLHIRTAPRERLADMRVLPSVSRDDPAVLVAVGVQVLTSS